MLGLFDGLGAPRGGWHGGGRRFRHRDWGRWWGAGFGVPWAFDGILFADYPVGAPGLTWVTLRVDGREVGSASVPYGTALLAVKELRRTTGPRYVELLQGRTILFNGNVSDGGVSAARARLGV